MKGLCDMYLVDMYRAICEIKRRNAFSVYRDVQSRLNLHKAI